MGKWSKEVSVFVILCLYDYLRNSKLEYQVFQNEVEMKVLFAIQIAEMSQVVA